MVERTMERLKPMMGMDLQRLRVKIMEIDRIHLN